MAMRFATPPAGLVPPIEQPAPTILQRCVRRRAPSSLIYSASVFHCRAPTCRVLPCPDTDVLRTPGPPRRRGGDWLCVGGAADDRAGVDAHLLGDDVLPFRLLGDFDRAVRTEREWRVRLSGPAVSSGPCRRSGARGARPALHRCDGRRVGRTHPAAGGSELLPRKPAADAGHLRTGRAALLRRRRGDLAGDQPVRRSRQCRVRGRSDRRGARVPAAHPAAEYDRRPWIRPGGSPHRQRRCAPVARRIGPPPLAAACTHRRSDAIGPAPGRIPVLRSAGHERARQRSFALQPLEFVLSRCRVRPEAWRLVAEPAIHRTRARLEVHGHRLSSLDADRPFFGPARRRLLAALRTHRARVSTRAGRTRR